MNKEILKAAEEAIKSALKPRVIWNSSENGTYIKAKHGPIGTVYQTNKQRREEMRV